MAPKAKTTTNVGDVRKTSSPGLRIAAASIDLFFIACLVTGFFQLLLVMFASDNTTTDATRAEAIAFVVILLVGTLLIFVLYSVLAMIRVGENNGQSIGKQFMGLRVITEDGTPISFKKAVRREALGKLPFLFVGYFVITIPFVLIIDFGWSKIKKGSRRTLHDVIGKTYVMYADDKFVTKTTSKSRKSKTKANQSAAGKATVKPTAPRPRPKGQRHKKRRK